MHKKRAEIHSAFFILGRTPLCPIVPLSLSYKRCVLPSFAKHKDDKSIIEINSPLQRAIPFCPGGSRRCRQSPYFKGFRGFPISLILLLSASRLYGNLFKFRLYFNAGDKPCRSSLPTFANRWVVFTYPAFAKSHYDWDSSLF